MLRKQQVLKDNKHHKYINDFLEQYVLVPADKATNNIIVVCRNTTELSIVNPSTYISVNKDCSTLIAERVVDLAKWNIAVASKMKRLPTLYWLPKLHKSPYGSRFIAALDICTTKPLSRLLTGCLSLVMTHFREYCEGIFKNTGVNCFWIINNSQQVVNTLQNINITSTAKHMDSYDFSTLYTSIPHASLKNNINILIDEAFKVRGAQYLACNKMLLDTIP